MDCAAPATVQFSYSANAVSVELQSPTAVVTHDACRRFLLTLQGRSTTADPAAIFTRFAEAKIRELEYPIMVARHPRRAVTIYANDAKFKEIDAALRDIVEQYKARFEAAKYRIQPRRLGTLRTRILPGLMRRTEEVADAFLLGRVLYVIATKETLKALDMELKDVVVPPEEAHQMRRQRNNGNEGAVCLMCCDKPDNTYVLDTCGCVYCLDCIQPMFTGVARCGEPMAIPVRCPMCQEAMGIEDIRKLSAKAFEAVAQSAVQAFLEEHRTTHRRCPNASCGTPIVVPTDAAKLKDVRCASCEHRFCFFCSDLLKRTVFGHEGKCAMVGVQGCVDFITDDIMNLHCPRCSKVFIDFSNCFAVHCMCNASFCGWCLKDCGDDDAHSHVRHCPKNRENGELFSTPEKFHEAHAERIRHEIVAYVRDRVPPTEQAEVLEKIVPHTTHLGAPIQLREIQNTSSQ
jgi:hypothetical protein